MTLIFTCKLKKMNKMAEEYHSITGKVSLDEHLTG